MIVNSGGGLGPMIVPRISGRTITTNLMRDAVAAHAKSLLNNCRRNMPPSRVRLSREIIRQYADTWTSNMERDPVKAYHDLFVVKPKKGYNPVMTKLSMLNQAPLAALGWGPKSWRAAQLAPRQRVAFSTEAKKGIAGMAVGSMLSPALDFVTKYVAPDPTDWWHVGGTIAKHAVSQAGAGALIGFGAGTATTGVGGVPAAGAGALVGGFIGLAEGIFDAWSEVKEYELKTAEDLKRYND